jgi:hypothetical protein
MKRNSSKRILTTTIKEKPVMRRVRKTLQIVLPAFVILAILAASGHAKKPTPPPEPTVAVTGVIEGTGDPKAIRVTFDESLAYEYPGEKATQGPVFVSNPDYSPSLDIVFAVPGMRNRLRYYYCVHKDHEDSDELICNDASHSPDYYYVLWIFDGISQTKNPRDTDHLVFPVGSRWQIGWKKDNSTVDSGTLSTETRYDVE